MIAWVPSESADVLNTATPPEIVAVPITEPSLKVTVPAAVDGDTVAVNPTLAPNAEGLAELVSDIAVVA